MKLLFCSSSLVKLSIKALDTFLDNPKATAYGNSPSHKTMSPTSLRLNLPISSIIR